MTILKPMLAQKFDERRLIRENTHSVSPKLDGIRCIIQNGIGYGRSGKPLPNRFLQWQISKLGDSFEGADGEIILGDNIFAKDVFNKTQSFVMSYDKIPNSQNKLSYYVFDNIIENKNRLFGHLIWIEPTHPSYISTHFHSGNNFEVHYLTQLLIRKIKDIYEYEDQIVGLGAEGVIIRDVNIIYEHKRSWSLMKLKRFEDAEAVIIGFDEEMQNNNEATLDVYGHTERASKQENMLGKGRLGSLKVRDLTTGVEFSVGSGFTAHDRVALWETRETLINRHITYKYQLAGVLEKPRFPVFKGFHEGL